MRDRDETNYELPVEARFPLSPRGTSGERAGERGTERPPLPDPLLLFLGGEGEGKRCCAPSKLLADHWRDARRYVAKHIPGREEDWFFHELTPYFPRQLR